MLGRLQTAAPPRLANHGRAANFQPWQIGREDLQRMATKLPYESHPYANLFPLDEGQPLWELSDDIKQHGQQVPITLYQDKILDGRRRMLACLRAGVEPKYRKFAGGDVAALAFVVSHNLHRRHLGTGDRAMIAAKVATMRQGNPNFAKTGNKPNAPEATGINAGLTQPEAAELLNVSERSVRNARAIIDHGTAELKKAVESHVVSVSDAAKIAAEPPAVQRRAVARVRSGKSPTAAAAVPKPEPKDRRSKPITDTRCLNLIKTCEAALSEEDADEALRLALDAAKAARELCLDMTHHPTLDEVKAYCEERKNSVNAETWFAHYKSNGWMVGKNRMRDWRAAVVTWEGNEKKWTKERSDGKATGRVSSPQSSIDAWERKAARTRS